MTSVTGRSSHLHEALGSEPLHISFPSGGTGSIVDDDYGIRSSDWDLTSDPFQNCVDLVSRIPRMSERAYVVFNVDNPLARLLQTIPELHTNNILLNLECHLPPKVTRPRPVAAQAEDPTPPEPEEPTLSDLVTEIHSLSGLSVNDAARMIGLGRRQFYNLVNGFSTKPSTERHIRLLAEQLTEIANRLDHDPKLIRAAILTPLGADSTNYFDAAESRDAEALRKKLASLLHRIDTRGIRRVRRAIPRKAAAGTRAARRKLAMEALAGQVDRSDPASEERTDGTRR